MRNISWLTDELLASEGLSSMKLVNYTWIMWRNFCPFCTQPFEKSCWRQQVWIRPAIGYPKSVFIVLFSPSRRMFNQCLSLSLSSSEIDTAHKTPAGFKISRGFILLNFEILISEARTRKPQNAITHCFELEPVFICLYIRAQLHYSCSHPCLSFHTTAVHTLPHSLLFIQEFFQFCEAV
jgi:hypothetical protein